MDCSTRFVAACWSANSFFFQREDAGRLRSGFFQNLQSLVVNVRLRLIAVLRSNDADARKVRMAVVRPEPSLFMRLSVGTERNF